MIRRRKCWIVILGMWFTSLVHAGSISVEQDIELLTLDGVVVQENYWAPRAVKSGEHQLVFRFNKRVRDGGRDVTFMTPPLMLTVNMLANDDILLLAPKINTKSQAELYFSNRDFWRIKYQSGAVKTAQYEALTQETNLPKEAVHTLVTEYNKAQGNAFAPTQMEPTPEQTNDLLRSVQLLYIQANDTQRAEIKAWIENQ